jgi:hypothetical protein
MNTDFEPTETNASPAGSDPSPDSPFKSHAANSAAQASCANDDSLNFDLLENPQNWPHDSARQSELADLLEIHLAMGAHAEDIAHSLMPETPLKRFAYKWLLPAAALAIAVLPATYAVSRIRENSRMQARGAVLEAALQKRLQAELWADFFEDTLGLIKQVQTPAKYCDPRHEDRSGEIEQARKLYAMGRSLPLDGLDDQEALDARKKMQNWLTEVSANDACITPERALDLLFLALEMDLESKAQRLNRKLKEENSWQPS